MVGRSLFRSLLFIWAVFALLPNAQAKEKSCFYVDSYHAEYEWSAGIRRGLSQKLKGVCDLEMVQMDTKRHNTRMYSQDKGDEIAKIIEKKNPDIVIVSDDNATKDVLVRHFKNSKTPFVFCGVNWTADQYGLPFENATGMLEVVPTDAMIQAVKKALPRLRRVSFLSADTETERKEYDGIKKAFGEQGIEVQSYWAKTFNDWKRAFELAQDNDLVYFSNQAGINDWDKDQAVKFVQAKMKKLSVASQKWLVPYVAFAMTKVAEEQGEWSAETAIRILKGEKPKNIPVVKNSRFELYVNPTLLKKSHVKLDPELLAKAKSL